MIQSGLLLKMNLKKISFAVSSRSGSATPVSGWSSLKSSMEGRPQDCGVSRRKTSSSTLIATASSAGT